MNGWGGPRVPCGWRPRGEEARRGQFGEQLLGAGALGIEDLVVGGDLGIENHLDEETASEGTPSDSDVSSDEEDTADTLSSESTDPESSQGEESSSSEEEKREK